MRTPGPLNLLTDVKGLCVGQAADHGAKTGVTAILCDPPATAAVSILGGAPGTRETDLLEPHNTVETVNGIVLSGGSAFGLDAASGVQAYLREKGQGFAVGPHRIPIVPAAILFDLINGGNKDWGRYPPYRDLGYVAAAEATDGYFETGTAGAGTGALTATAKGGLGSASLVLENGVTVAALAAVNAMGAVTVGATRHFWASPFECNGEFANLGLPHPFPADARDLRIKFRDMVRGANTTIAVIATDAILTKAEAKRLAIAAHDGFARAIWPAHTPFDGDLVFALATGASGKRLAIDAFLNLCAGGSATMARAIARGVHDARPEPGDLLPSWRDLPAQ